MILALKVLKDILFATYNLIPIVKDYQDEISERTPYINFAIHIFGIFMSIVIFTILMCLLRNHNDEL